MCLSIAILCFGVISATSVEYSISGKITYEAPNLDVKVTTKTYGIPWYDGLDNEQIRAFAAEASMVYSCDEIRLDVLQGMMGDNWNNLTDEEKTNLLTMFEVSGLQVLNYLSEYGDAYFEMADSFTTINSSTWTPSSSSSSTNIEINYGDPSSETDKYWTYIIIISVENLSSDKPIKANLIDTTDISDGDNRNSLIWQTTDTLNYITTDDYETVTAEDGTETRYPTRNLVLIYSVKDLYTKTENVSFSYNVTITEDSEQSIGVPKTLLSDTTNSYYYVNFGKPIIFGATKHRPKWRLVSLDGETKYSSFSSYSTPTLQPGKSLFVQETALGDSFEFDTNNGNNYFTSSIRAKVQTGEYLGLTESDISDFIEPVELGSIDYYVGSDSSYTVDSDVTAITKDNSDTTRDYFYLMSYAEFNTFISSDAIYYDGSGDACCYCLRNPWSRSATTFNVQTNSIMYCYEEGKIAITSTFNHHYIRSMFTLSSSYSG